MENTFFEAPEYPIWDRLKRCAVLFVKQAVCLLGVMLLVRVIEMAFGSHLFHPKESLIILIVEGIIYTLIYFIKALPFLFVIYTVLFFSNIGAQVLKICNFILFAIYILIEVFLAKYFFTSQILLGDDIFIGNSNFLSKIISFNLYLTIAIIVSLVVLWFAMQRSKLITFVDNVYALSILSVGLVMLFFGVSALPNDDGTENFKVKVSKSAYFFDRAYTHWFDKEPNVDIYDQNYFD